MIENNIIHDTSPFLEVDLLTCPLCLSSLQSCSECDVTVACSNQHCTGSQVVNWERCDHHEAMVCHECLDLQDQDTIPHFARCPTCNSWWCMYDMVWCPGRIIYPEPGTEEPAKLSRKYFFDSKSIVRSHSPTPGPCISCVDSGHADAWQECNGDRTVLCLNNACCIDNFGLSAAYCPECITGGKGRRCTCGSTWLCDTCSVHDSPNHPHLLSCPRCGAMYCREPDGCQYCHFCDICHRTGVCIGCQAQEKGDVGGKDTSSERSQPVQATIEQCVECQADMCHECCSTTEHGVVQCLGCHHWMCGSCASDREERCHSCTEGYVDDCTASSG